MPVAGLKPDEAAVRLGALAETKLAVIALSGGADSTCLAWLAAQYGTCQFICVTIDHGLRPEARAEAEAAQAMARGLGHQAIIRSWQGDKPKTGIQAAARAARYAILAEVAREYGAQAILTAHNQEDVAETFIMRLARGSGVDGLAAMTGDGEVRGIRLLRPLLDVSRAEIIATLRNYGLVWSEDPSNELKNFERVRVRQAMQAHFPEFGLSAEKIALTARRLARARSALEASVLQWQQKIFPKNLISEPFSLNDWRQMPEEIGVRMLFQAFPDAELAQIEAIMEWFELSEDGARTLQGHEIRRKGDIVQISAEKPRRNASL